MKLIVFVLFFIISSNSLHAQNHSVQQSNRDSLSLYIFLLDDCPICINYVSSLNDLFDKYGNKISFQGYFPNFSSKQDEIDSFQQTYNIQFPLKTDYYKKQAKKWNAQVTPEVILYNHSLQSIIYQGRIDNRYVRLGKRRNIVTEHNLINAIENTLSAKEVVNKYSEPVGCYINYSDQINKNNKP